MRTNPFDDAWMFLTGSTDEHAASGIGWLLTALFLRSSSQASGSPARIGSKTPRSAPWGIWPPGSCA
jgi:hypothetical protein